WISIMVTSGRCDRNISIASDPLDASAISFMSGSALTSAAIPLRRRGWSSTVSIRITLGSLLMASCLTEYFKAVAVTWCFVSNGSRNGQLNFSAGARFAPNIQLRSDLLRSFPHTGKAPVPGCAAFGQDCRSDAFAIIADAQTKFVNIVSNLSFDLLRLRMAEGISQDFAGNLVNVVLETGGEFPPLALDDHSERRRGAIPIVRGSQFLACRSQRFCQVSVPKRFGTQVLNSIPAFSDSLLGGKNGVIQGLNGLLRVPAKHVAGPLKLKHESIQTLQQALMYFVRNTSQLIDGRFQGHVTLQL